MALLLPRRGNMPRCQTIPHRRRDHDRRPDRGGRDELASSIVCQARESRCREMSVPRSTYRLQLHAGFGLDAAAGIVDYLCELGISHVYCSPYLQAAPGSTHGYDVVDYHRVSVELGGEEARARLCAKLTECGMGQELDIV